MPGVKIPGRVGKVNSKFGEPEKKEEIPKPKIKKIKKPKADEPATEAPKPKAGQLPTGKSSEVLNGPKAPAPETKQAPKVTPPVLESKKEVKATAKAAEPAKPAAAKPPTAKKAPKKKKKKATSSVFSQFEQQQIQEFKEAFQMIDQDRNGIIDEGDLKATYAALGIRFNDKEKLQEMIAEADGATINFTVFLNMLADKLHGTDPEEVILKAFRSFDKANTGLLPLAEFKQALTTYADRMDDAEFETVLPLLQINDQGQVDYKALCYTLTHGASPEDEDSD